MGQPVGTAFPARAAFFSLAAPGRHRYHPLTQGRGRSSGVEHNLAKVGVVSSNLIARSKKVMKHRTQRGPVLLFLGLRCARQIGRNQLIQRLYNLRAFEIVQRICVGRAEPPSIIVEVEPRCRGKLRI